MSSETQPISSRLLEIQTRVCECNSIVCELLGGESSTGLSDKKLLREAILEAVEAIEESRQAFKSKQLEQVRKKLIAVLARTA